MSEIISFQELDDSWCDRLTALTFASKAHWGYSKEQMLSWKDELTITPTYFKSYDVIGLLCNQQVLGYYALQVKNEEIGYLDQLFVDPSHLQQGLGKSLLDHAHDKARNKNLKKVYLYADPNAEEFYRKMGYRTIEKKESSIKNRFLPVMEINLI